jgi:hypothetical protein
MSSTTGEHINELEERRQRRQQRNAARSGPAKPPRSAITAPEARDLLRDLITEGSRLDEGGAGHSDIGSLRATEDSRNGSIGTESKHQPSARRNGEGVDDLVRRVQAGTQTAAAEAEHATRRARPIGTADLSADAATQNPARRRAGRNGVADPLHRVESNRRAAWAAAAAIVLIVGVAFALSLDSAGERRTATTHSAPILATVAGLASAVRVTTSTVDRELEALTHQADGQVHPRRRATKRPRVRPQKHHARTARATSATQSQPVHVTSTPATSSQTATSTQQSNASSGRSTAGGASSSSGSAQPAGPTNASPLGGIGSCVRGCS